ncbi:DUF6332 family protein [Streptomyces sp. NPDC086787]|uniref:DUF6332 family protein n=1 Tax=Streptomyces sp. NPDC086787 TaxID=3365759 RepID=UPI00381B6594
MDGYGGRRNKPQQDAATVEFGYALISAVFAAAVVFGAVAGPALLFEPPRVVATALLWTGLALAAVVLVVRFVSVLVRFHRTAR